MEKTMRICVHEYMCVCIYLAYLAVCVCALDVHIRVSMLRVLPFCLRAAMLNDSCSCFSVCLVRNKVHVCAHACRYICVCLTYRIYTCIIYMSIWEYCSYDYEVPLCENMCVTIDNFGHLWPCMCVHIHADEWCISDLCYLTFFREPGTSLCFHIFWPACDYCEI